MEHQLSEMMSTTSQYHQSTDVQSSSPGTISSLDGYQITKLIVLPLIIIFGLIGNLLVCVAITKTPKLRKVVNYYLLSLAVSDLLVCAFVMPLAIYQEITGEWRMSTVTCRVWVLFDVLLCTSSIWNLCLVSIDRFLAITKPIKYTKYRTPRNAAIAIFLIWLISFITAFVMVFALVTLTGRTEMEDYVCQVGASPIVGIVAALVAFFIPCAIISVLYIHIFMAIRKNNRKHSSLRKSVAYQAAKLARQQTTVSRDFDIKTDKSSTGNELSSDHPSSGGSSGRKLSGEASGKSSQSTLKRMRSRLASRTVNSLSIRREMKTAIVLAIVVIVFIACWLPYFIIYLVTLWSELDLQKAFQIATWLGWSNSLINPVIYTIFNEDFRQAFKNILLCRN